MFGNNDENDDGSTDTEYAVIDFNGNELVRFSSRDVAERKLAAWPEAEEIEESEPEEGSTEDEKTSESFAGPGDDNAGGVAESQNYRDVFDPNRGEDDTEDAAADGGTQSDIARRWSLGDHSTITDEEQENLQSVLDGLDDDVDADLRGVLEEASTMVRGSSVSDFECPVCGLKHGHSDQGHDIRRMPDSRRGKAPGFAVEDTFADMMDFVPYCHCGANELAMIVDFFGFINVGMFKDQHEFEAVLELPNEVVQSIFRAKRDLESSAPFDVPMQDAINEAGYRYDVPPDVIPDLETFYERVQNIKDAADGAPIPGDARRQIEETREELQSMVDEA